MIIGPSLSLLRERIVKFGEKSAECRNINQYFTIVNDQLGDPRDLRSRYEASEK